MVIPKPAELTGKINRASAVKICIHLTGCIFSFLLSSISFNGELYPFGIAFAGGSGGEYLISACVGCAFGALVFCPKISALRYISACVLMFFLRTVLTKRFRESSFVYIYPAFSFCSLLLCSLSVSLACDAAVSELVLILCDSVLCGAGTVFSYKISEKIHDGTISSGISQSETVAFLLWGSLLLLALGKFEIAGFSPARVFSFLAVIILSFCGGVYTGTLTGLCTGGIFGYGELHPQLVISLPFGGLLCGLCADYGKIAVATAFAAVNTLAVFLKGNPETAFVDAVEYISASIIFSLIPNKLLSRLSDYLLPLTGDKTKAEDRKLLAVRIKRRAKAIRDVAFSSTAVLRFLSKTDTPDIGVIPYEVKEDICTDCLKYNFCWERNGNFTMDSFNKCLKTADETGRITPETLPERLSIICREKNSLCDSFNRLLCEYNARFTARREIFEAKCLAASQFQCAADIMEDAAEKAVTAPDADGRLTAIAERVFSSLGYEYSFLLVSGEKQGQCILEAFCTALPAPTDWNKLVQKLSLKTDIEFMLPAKEEYRNEGTALCFCEKTDFDVSFHKISKTGEGEKLCGDSCETFFDGRGNFYCILSDGMGSGTRAALDSVMTVSLFAKFMKAGFGTETAFTAVNSALKVKSADETLSTLDILKINLYTGIAEIYKAGAAFTVICHSDKVSFCEISSLPLGIFGETHFEHTSYTLGKGDIIIMLSDGAAHIEKRGFADILRNTKKESPVQICNAVITAAEKATPSGKTDDITAVCIKIKP